MEALVFFGVIGLLVALGYRLIPAWRWIVGFQANYERNQASWPKGLKAPWHSRDSKGRREPVFPKQLLAHSVTISPFR
jgi:hypothetical protein